MFLDTTFCIDLMREHHRRQDGPATRKLRALTEVPLRVSLFVLAELHAGARLSAHPDRELRRVELFSDLVEVVLPTRSLAVTYGETEARLRRAGTPLSTMDLLIGLQALIEAQPLLTRNRTDFERIPGLVVESY